MKTYVVRLTKDGQTWYANTEGLRIDSEENAKRYTKADAEMVAGQFRDIWKAEAEVIELENS